MSEHVFSDFSGGMNAIAPVDKLDPRECLLAENVRLDETGNIQSAGAFTAQNTSAYTAVVNTSYDGPYAAARPWLGALNPRRFVHSLYWNPSFGAVAGSGSDIFSGPTLGSMVNTLSSVNVNQQKISFASAPNRVYFDIGNVGYWTDQSIITTVDWPPPSASGATTTGPTYVGTSSQISGGVAWTNPGALSSNTATATATLSHGGASTQIIKATMSTNSFAIGTAAVSGITVTFTAESSPTNPSNIPNSAAVFTVTLLKNGVPVGESRTASPTTPFVINTFQTYQAGSPTDTWGTTFVQADINSGNYGFQVQATNPNGNDNRFQVNVITAYAYGGQIKIYQALSGGGMVAGTGTTGLLTGTYMWKVTFVATNGEESDASIDTAPVVLSAQQGTLTSIPLGDSRTVARNIYRIGGALTSHYLIGGIGNNAYTIANNVSTTYSDNATDIAALAEGAILSGDVPGDYPNTRLGSTQVRFPVYHYDRTFWINQQQKNQIVWSKPLNGFAYPAINFINVGDSKPISRIVSIFGELIIIKTDSIWRLTGTDETSFNLTRTPSTVGTDLPFTVVDLPDKIVFENRWGLWVFNGYTSVPLTNKLDGWFKQQNRTNVSLFGRNGFETPEVADPSIPLSSEAVGNGEKYVLIYPESGENLSSSMLIFDLKHSNITRRTILQGETLQSPMLSLALDPVNGFVYMGDSNGFVSLVDDWNGPNQNGLSANFDFQHGYQDLERGSNKSLWALEFYLNTNGQALTPYVYYDNGTSSETLAPISATGLQRIVRPVEAGTARKMQNFAWRLNGSLSSVNVTGTPQVEIVHVKALYDVRTGRARTGQ